jgi:NTE family protein
MEITLALGGGGVKGNSHIGVIRRLEKEGFHIRAVAGTSFGGLVAALYSLGHSADDLEEMFASLDQTQLYGHVPEDAPSLIGVAGITRWLEEVVGSRTFDDLKLPCVVTAADLKSGKEVLLSSGPLIDAVLATIALPGILPARHIEDLELVDGGTLDPVPVGPARQLAPRLPVVAIVLNCPMGVPARPWRIPFPRGWIRSLVSRLLSRMRYGPALDVFSRSLDMTARAVTHYRLKVDRPDVIIRPDVLDMDAFQIVDVHEVVKKGEEAAEAALPELRRLFSWRSRWRRSMTLRTH